MTLQHALRGRTRYPGLVNQAFSKFTPLSIADCALWLECNPKYLFKDASKTEYADTSSDLIYTWADRSGNGNDAVQATEGSRPTFIENAFNGDKSTVRFSGSKFMTIPDDASYKASYITLFMISKNPSNGTVTIAYPHATYHTGPYFRWVVYRGTSSTTINLRIDTSDWSTGSNDLNVMHILTYMNNPRTHWHNITQYASTTARAITYPNSVGIHLGQNSSGGERFSGDISEIILYSRTLSTIERELVYAYLATKWGF